MRTENIPDATIEELLEEDHDLEVKTAEELREELEDYYEARDELDAMIVATEQFVEGIITLRDAFEVLDSLGDEDGQMALDRI